MFSRWNRLWQEKQKTMTNSLRTNLSHQGSLQNRKPWSMSWGLSTLLTEKRSRTHQKKKDSSWNRGHLKQRRRNACVPPEWLSLFLFKVKVSTALEGAQVSLYLNFFICQVQINTSGGTCRKSEQKYQFCSNNGSRWRSVKWQIKKSFRQQSGLLDKLHTSSYFP